MYHLCFQPLVVYHSLCVLRFHQVQWGRWHLHLSNGIFQLLHLKKHASIRRKKIPNTVLVS